jgi:hypothetical protein
MTPPLRLRPPLLPDHWTPAQALAVFEMIDLLRDQLWLAYGTDIQLAMRDDQQHSDPRQLRIPLDPDPPF